MIRVTPKDGKGRFLWYIVGLRDVPNNLDLRSPIPMQNLVYENFNKSFKNIASSWTLTSHNLSLG